MIKKGDLQAMTKAVLIDHLLELAGPQEETVQTLAPDGPHGQVRREQETRNAEGKVLRRQAVAWTYYPTGEVDEITVRELDAMGVQTGGYVVKHFKDGRQPERV